MAFNFEQAQVQRTRLEAYCARHSRGEITSSDVNDLINGWWMALESSEDYRAAATGEDRDPQPAPQSGVSLLESVKGPRR